MNKKLLLAAVTVTVLGAGFFGISTVSAQTASSRSSSIVQKIADRFGLNKDEVQKVFDEEHAARRTEMQAKMEERLNTLVTEGKITAEQKMLIQNKMKELQAERQANKEKMKSLTPEQMKEEMESKKTELDAWAKENGIDPQYLMFKMKFKGNGQGMMFEKHIQ